MRIANDHDEEFRIYASGPSMFAVDPAAENEKFSLYARQLLLILASSSHVHRMGTKSEGPGAI